MDPLYLDHAATTPVRPEVRESMARCLGEAFGNPSSSHRWGRAARVTLDEARRQVAAVLGATPGEIHFVRGGTESDNLAIFGRAARARTEGRSPRIAVSAVEHPAVLRAAEAATAPGGAPVILSVDRTGALDMDALDRALLEGLDVVSVMWVNNEVGTALPVREVAERVRAAGSVFHSDAVQAVGTLTVRVDQLPVDLLTLTGHKIYGPKGTGILFVRRGVSLEPLLRGGGQEGGIRPGTEDVAGAVGFAEALRLTVAEQEREHQRLSALRDDLERRLRSAVSGVRVHGEDGPRAPHISSLGISGVDGASLVMALDMEGIGVSGGSACASGSTRPSHVIEAMYGSDGTWAALRFSLGRTTTDDDVRRAADATARVVARLRDDG